MYTSSGHSSMCENDLSVIDISFNDLSVIDISFNEVWWLTPCISIWSFDVNAVILSSFIILSKLLLLENKFHRKKEANNIPAADT